VNSFGFLNHSRYLPDRRDLNRCFPGSPNGSLASRLAHIFMTEIVARCSLGIDLHSAAIHRTNLPQVRVSANDAQTLHLAHVFGAPVILTSGLRDGSLRAESKKSGVSILLFEAGEAMRFDEMSVRSGVAGIMRVLKEIGMLSGAGIAKPKAKSIICAKSNWLRAPVGGLLRNFKAEGDVVEEGDGDLMGDGVNIAARLEGIAEAGAICMSEDAYRQVRSRLDLSVKDMGEQTLKNIAEPMKVYALKVGTASMPSSSRVKGLVTISSITGDGWWNSIHLPTGRAETTCMSAATPIAVFQP
jgi:predicted deacylase